MKQELIDTPNPNYNESKTKKPNDIKATCPKCDTYGRSIANSNDLTQWKCPHCGYKC